MIPQTLAVTLFTLLLGGTSFAATGSCGDEVVVKRADNLSQIAERCEVSERTILLANPGVESSQDLKVGEMLHLDPIQHAQESFGSTARALTQSAKKGVQGLTSSIGSSVEGFMNRNPDVKAKLNDLGEGIGLSSRDAVGTVSVTPQNPDASGEVTLSVDDLPHNGEFDIGVGTPGHAYEVAAQATASATGHVETQIVLPDWLSSGSKAIFVLTDPGGTILARSKPIALN